MSFIRTSFFTLAVISRLSAVTAIDHPLYFEQRPNGQFETRSASQSVTIHADRMELDGVTLRFIHASGKARLEGHGTPAPATYMTRGATVCLRQYPQAVIRSLYPGIDVVFYGYPGHLEYDLNLAPGVTPESIRLDVSGARAIRLGEQGELIIDTLSGELKQLAPRVFQTDHGVRRKIASKYALLASNEVGFRLGKHDEKIPLTIDPVIVYTKYFGGSSSDMGGPVATDPQGNVYITGSTNSADFPITNGTKARLQPPLLALSNGGQTVTPLRVGTQTSVTAIGGTADGNVLYVATPDGIFISGNHGASFSPAVPLTPDGTVLAISVDAIDPSRALVATTAGLFVINGAGQIAGRNESGMAVVGNGTVSAASVQISAVDHLIAYATTATPNYLYKTTNAAASWNQLNPAYPGEPPPGPFSGTSIAFTLAPGGTDLYVINGNANLLRSTDGGTTWQQLAGQLFGAQSITIDRNNPATIYVVDNFGVQRSTNGGASFTTSSPPLPGGIFVRTFALDSSTGNLYFATFNQIEVSVDQGATWQTLPPRPNPQVLLGLGNQVFAGVTSPAIPFVVKWSPDGSKMLYSTFFGGSYSESITAIAVDPQGEAIVAGSTASFDFPVTQTLSKPSTTGFASGFVAKLSVDGTQTIYSSVIGASQGLTINGLAIDATGAPYITGFTASPDFPTTGNALQAKLPTATCQRPNGNPLSPVPRLGDYAFVTKLSVDAISFVYSSFLTGVCGSAGQGITVDAAGEAVVVGETTSADFPVSSNAYQSTFPGGIAASLAFPNAVDLGFVTKLSAAGDKAIASSLIGGGYFTQANAVTLDASGNAYITGSTWGITPGATPGAYQTKINSNCPPTFSIGPGIIGPTGGSDAFVLKLDPAFSQALFLTYLGGACDDSGDSIVLAPNGNVWVGGFPSQGSFPLQTPFALSGNFVGELSADASQLLFSSYSDGGFLAADPSGAIYVAGTTPYGRPKTTGFATGNSVCLTKLDPASNPPMVINSIGPVSAAAQSNVQFAPGELLYIKGKSLGPGNTVLAQLDTAGRLPFFIGQTSVTFDGYDAPLLSLQDGLIECVAPFEITSSTLVTVRSGGQNSNTVRIGVAASAPYIVAIANQDNSINSASHPAAPGSVLTFYVSGLGITAPLSQDGSVSAFPLPVPVALFSVSIGNSPLRPQFVAAAVGLIAGTTQINVQVPSAGNSPNPVSVSIGGAFGQIYLTQ